MSDPPGTTVSALTPHAIEQALAELRVVPVYQPCFDLGTGAMVAVEALARVLDTASGTLLPPSSFLPAAEATGLVQRVDAAIHAQAIHQVAAWRRTPAGRDLCLAVNVSVWDLDNVELPDELLGTAEAAGLSLDALIIEVTETVLSQSGRGHEAVLARLTAAGCNVTLDDFGTGNNSLAYLQRFRVQGLKIDRSFVRELGSDPPPRMVECFLAFCLALEVHVVAEGIETDAQLQALKALGCPFGQGYLLSPPLPAVQLEALLGADTGNAGAVGVHGQVPVATRVVAVSSPGELPPARPLAPAVEWPRTGRSSGALSLVAALMVVVMLGLALLTVQEHRSARRSLTAAGQDKLSAVGSLAASAVGAELAGLDELVTAHSRREVAVAAVGAASSEAERDAILEALRTASASIFSSSLYDASGTLLALQPSVPGVVGRNFAFRDWYRGARVSEGAYLSEAFQLMTPAHPWAVASAAAVRDGRGGVVGFLVATYDLSKLQSLVDRFQIEHGVGMTVVDRRGQVLAAPLSGAGTTRTGDRTADVSLLSALGLHTPSPIAAAKAPGQWVVQQVPLVGGVVRVEQPVRAALAGYAGQGQRDRALLGAVLAAALLLVGLVLHTDRRRRRLVTDLAGREAFLDTLLSEVDAGVVACDATGRVTFSNDRDQESLTLLGEALQKQRPIGNVELQLENLHGPTRRLRASARPLRDKGGRVVGAVMVTHDITDLARQRQELRQAGEWVSALLEATPSAVAVTGAEGNVLQANQACVRLIGVPRETLIGLPLSTWMPSGVTMEEGADLVVAALRRPDGDVLTLEVRSRALRDPAGELVHMHSFADVTPHRIERDLLRRQTQTDILTGLANRLALREALAHLIAEVESRVTRGAALVFLDLDGFKAVNDTFGHSAGDALLCDVAEALLVGSRADDVVARLGGDEFVVLARLGDPHEATELAERLRVLVGRACRLTAGVADLKVDVSIGVALVGPDGSSAEALLAAADRRMYAEKRASPRTALPVQRGGAPDSPTAPRLAD